MSTQKFIRPLSTANPHQQTASNIARVLSHSGIQHLKNSPLILSTLNSHIVQLVLSNSTLPLPSCLDFFNFLRQNPVNKLDLVTHLTFIRSMYCGITPTLVTFSTLVNIFSKIGNFKEAKRLFEGMNIRELRPNIVIYSVDGYCKIGNLEEAKWLFEEMEKRGVKPNIVTYSALIGG
ncbi:hypothetical protein Dsin_001234 [Dipteronia sinensis]|uniref:Pentatricopeptide repeat-containing protein n=1 Tax=Dipteronia sinensis TaxID=43782 RepID=A0AAE0B4D5_9ROSI|nr:hypothetical protein Dsin_001234 [Dipteronia sinensis]